MDTTLVGFHPGRGCFLASWLLHGPNSMFPTHPEVSHINTPRSLRIVGAPPSRSRWNTRTKIGRSPPPTIRHRMRVLLYQCIQRWLNSGRVPRVAEESRAVEGKKRNEKPDSPSVFFVVQSISPRQALDR